MSQSGWIRSLAAAAAVAVVCAGCDSVPDAGPFDGVPPQINSFTFAPNNIDISALPPEQRTDSTALIPLSIRVTASDPDGTVGAVVYVLDGLSAEDPPVLEGLLRQSGGEFTLDTTLVLSFGAIGNYPLLVFAVDTDAQMSNRARGVLKFNSSAPIGGPPVIEDVEADPEIVRPPTTFRLIATVSDPDGLENILKVSGTAPNGSEFQMFDDGVSFGDDVADDGRFTAQFDVPAANPGTQVFRIQAVDRSGLTSDVFEKEVTIE